MNKTSLTAAFAASLLLAGAAHAARTTGVALLTPVAIDPASQISNAVRDECRIDYQLEANVLDAMRHYDQEVQTTTDPSSGRVLKVAITYVLGVGGGAWTGPKAIAVHLELLKDGKVEFTTKMHRRSSLFGGGFKGTCELLDGASKGLGKMIAKWVQRPKSSAVDEEPDADLPASAPPAPASAASP